MDDSDVSVSFSTDSWCIFHFQTVMRVLGVDFRGQAGRISIVHRERVSRMIMEDEILISVSHN